LDDVSAIRGRMPLLRVSRTKHQGNFSQMIAIWKVPVVSNNPRKNNEFFANTSAV
jgi:hypothetical protein